MDLDGAGRTEKCVLFSPHFLLESVAAKPHQIAAYSLEAESCPDLTVMSTGAPLRFTFS